MALMRSAWKEKFWNLPVLGVIACAVFAAIAPYYTVLFDWSNILLFRDLQLSFLPAKKVWVESVLTYGHIPYWNHLGLAGVPYWADCNQQPLYPLNLVFLFFKPENLVVAFSFFLSAHYFLLYIGAYLLFRRLNFSYYLALLFAFVATWSGVAISANNVPHILSGILATYWFFWALIGLLQKPSWGAAFAVSFWWAWPLFGGDPQYPYLFGIFAVLIFLVFSPSKKGALYLVAAGFLTLLLSAAQLLPTIDLSLETVRGSEAENIGFLMWGLHPIRLWEIIFPQILGNITPIDNYTGGPYINFDGNRPFIFANYLSLGLVWFAGYAVILRQRKLLILFAAILLGYWISMGDRVSLSLYVWLAKIIPFWNLFRYSERLIIFPSIGMVILSAYGLRAWLQSAATRSKALYILAILSLVAIFPFAFRFGFELGDVFHRQAIQQTFLFSALTLLVLALYQKKILQDSLFKGVFILIVLFELWISARAYVWEQSREYTYVENYPHILKIKNDLEQRQAEIAKGAPDRVYFLNSFDYDWNYVATRQKIGLLNVESAGGWRNLAGNIGFMFNFPMATGYYSLQLLSPADIWHALREKPVRLMNLLGVRYIRPKQRAGIPEINVNLEALPYLHQPQKFLGFMSESTIIKNILLSNTPLQDSAYLQLQKTDELVPSAGIALDFSNLKKDFQKISFQAERRQGATGENFSVVVNERFSPYWKAQLNGKSIPIRKVNAWAMLLHAPADTNQEWNIVLSYENPWIRYGNILSLIWILLAATYLIFCFSKKAADSTITPKENSSV